MTEKVHTFVVFLSVASGVVVGTDAVQIHQADPAVATPWYAYAAVAQSAVVAVGMVILWWRARSGFMVRAPDLVGAPAARTVTAPRVRAIVAVIGWVDVAVVAAGAVYAMGAQCFWLGIGDLGAVCGIVACVAVVHLQRYLAQIRILRREALSRFAVAARDVAIAGAVLAALFELAMHEAPHEPE